MAVPTLALVGFSVALTIFAGPLFGLCERAAHELDARTPYSEAVFGEAP